MPQRIGEKPPASGKGNDAVMLWNGAQLFLDLVGEDSPLLGRGSGICQDLKCQEAMWIETGVDALQFEEPDLFLIEQSAASVKLRCVEPLREESALRFELMPVGHE